MQDDTIKLLRECNSGIKMGISSLDDVIDDVQSGGLREILKDSREIHCRLGSETHQYLIKYNDEGKEPAPMAKTMRRMFKAEALPSPFSFMKALFKML